MEKVYAWAKNLVFCLCLLELLCHLVRSGSYRRYIRFFGGLVVLLLVLSPVAGLFSLDASFDEALRQAFAREEAYELQMSQEALFDLQNRQISDAYRAELKRQMEEIAAAHGQRAVSIDLTLKEEASGSPSALTGIRIVLAKQNGGLNVFEEDRDADARQREAADAIASEIAAVYGVAKGEISVSVKE